MLALACTPAMCAAGAPTTRPAAARAPDLRLAAPAPTRRRRSSVVVAPPAALPYLAEVGDKLPVEKAELPNWLALAAFAAAAVAKQANLRWACLCSVRAVARGVLPACLAVCPAWRSTQPLLNPMHPAAASS